MALIEIRNLSKTFAQNHEKIHALSNVNLSIEKADIFGIIGMSGAGKSTLVRCLNYLEKPSEGEVIIDGSNLGTLSGKELRTQRRDIAMIFQHFNLLMQKNVIDNVCFPLKIQKVKRKEAYEKAMELLRIVGLESKAKAYPSQLSGGQKQRVAIARALASSPKILLCDEATSALDPQTTTAILDLLKKINHDLGITIVIITHQMNVVQEICNKVAIIESGKVVEQGTVSEIFENPKSESAKKLIYGDLAAPLPPADVNKGGVKKIRVVFSKNSAFEPVIANMILHFQTTLNILQANTQEIAGMAVGEMILGLPEDPHLQLDMQTYLRERGLMIQEVE